MQLHQLPRSQVVTVAFQNPLTLLGGILLCIVPMAVQGQSVIFTGAQTTLLASGLDDPAGIATDDAGDVFIADSFNLRVVELPRTATGYGPPMTLPVNGVSNVSGVAVDGNGNVFVSASENNRVEEFPKTASGYGPPIDLSVSGLSEPAGLAVDSAGDLFIANALNHSVVKLLNTSLGWQQVTLPANGLDYPEGIAIDGSGDVFIADPEANIVVELPWTGAGYGAQVTLPVALYYHPNGVAVDNAGNVYFTESSGQFVEELPKKGTGYGPETSLPINVTGSHSWSAVAVDSIGNVFVADNDKNRVVELQRQSANFAVVNVCAPGQTLPAPCSETLQLAYHIKDTVMLGTPKVLTSGAPNPDFTLASGGSCIGPFNAGSSCTINVTFAPLVTGARNGSVEIIDTSGNVLATTPTSGFGQAVAIDFGQGFAQSQGTLQFNGNAFLADNFLELTNGGTEQASSAFYTTPVNVQSFTTDFEFLVSDAKADGFTFTIQNAGLGALGGHGGDLGYAGIANSLCLKFDLYRNPGDPSNNSTGIFVDGARPMGIPSSIGLGGSVNLHSGHLMDAHITYSGVTLTLTITDTATSATWTHAFIVGSIPGIVGGNTAYVGFTGATGGLSAIQQIQNWTFVTEAE